MAADRLEHLSSRLSSLERQVALLAGEAEALKTRKASLEREVGFAKGRLALKGSVSQFLEELQTEAHARRVGDFEKLLTALVSEVLPQEAPIGLELEIERGNPSLDIVSRFSADRTEDIYDDKGGALTNVVSMGLRMIAVVRSGMNRFLMLDESDCWIANSRVPAFYSVLKDAAKKVGVQCLAVSHHDIATIGEGINTAKLSGHPEMPEGVRIENNPRPYRWRDDEIGIRWIRLVNFQGYVDQTLYLSPGVNALVGENGIGKSSFIRAFRAVFYGEARDSLIRHGAKSCEVEICFGEGKVLRWDRQARRNPVNIWKYIGIDGSVISGNGMTYETGGRSVPDWVTDIFRIGPVEGLDVHAIKQKEPVFLLNKPGSTRAAVLSVGRESGHIRKMISLHKEQCAADAATVKSGEAEMGVILNRLERLESVAGLEASLRAARETSVTISATEQETGRLEEAVCALSETWIKVSNANQASSALANMPEGGKLKALETAALNTKQLADMLDTLEETSSRYSKESGRRSSLVGLPETFPQLKETGALTDALQDIETSRNRYKRGLAVASALETMPAGIPQIVSNDDLIVSGKAVKDTRRTLLSTTQRQKVFASLPYEIPVLQGTEDQALVLELIGRTAMQADEAHRMQSNCATEFADSEKDLEAAVAEMGNICPLCSSEVTDARSFLDGHVHAREDAHA